MRIFAITVCVLAAAVPVSADVIEFKNGDKLTAEIVEDKGSSLTITSPSLGTITIDKTYLASYKSDEDIAREAAIEAKGPTWTRSVSLGFAQSGGNDESLEGSFDINVKRKTDRDELDGRLKGLYEEEDGAFDNRAFYGLGRYAQSFGRTMRWYRFIKTEADKNHENNIDYRVTPSAGVGYWFADKDEFKAMVELAGGVEHTKFRMSGESDTEGVLIPRGFLDKTFANGARLTEDLIFYPSLGDFGEFRLRSETVFSKPISETVAWKLSFVDEYDSDTEPGVEGNDYKLITSLEVTF